ncbi:MAG: shikimate dehydrogenase [Pseudobutyrivibrio sp.]|nr:shikimate dehydrogenase [Pseudobutyrivibrio sp.]
MDISGATRLICLLGSPVEHSISPKMHNTAFRALDLDYSYMAFDIKEEQIKEAISSLMVLNCRGFNLTMPLKRAIIPYLDEISDVARLSNSVNTCLIEDGKLKGYSTDGTGFMQSMASEGIHYQGKEITILGAGGAATSIITQAAFEKVSAINIFKRKNASFDDTVALANRIASQTQVDIKVYDMADSNALKESLRSSQILINGTNVGMGDSKESLVPIEFLRPDLAVCDVIYHPEETKLLSDAKRVGAKTMNGKLMLLYQGAAAFKIWTNQDMPIDLVKETCFK